MGVAIYHIILWFYPPIVKPEVKFEAYLTLGPFVTNFPEKYYSSVKLASFAILGSISGAGGLVTKPGTKRNGTKLNETKWKRSSKVWTLV